MGKGLKEVSGVVQKLQNLGLMVALVSIMLR